MRAKEYIIQKLVDMGKRHRWMKYPTLALVSIISLFFLIVEKCMERPKRAVIVLVCLVLIISQSWYLISIASETDTLNPQTGTEVGDETVLNGDGDTDSSSENDVASSEGNDSSSEATSEDTGITYSVFVNVGTNGTENIEVYNISASEIANGYSLDQLGVTAKDSKCYAVDKWYITNGLNNGKEITTGKLEAGDFTNYHVSLEVTWRLKAYRVTFEPGDGGSGEAKEVIAEIGEGDAVAPTIDATVLDQGYTREGYTFSQWRINDSTINTTPLGEPYTISGTEASVVLTPDWKPITYFIEFVKNDKKAYGTMDNITVSYDSEVTLPISQFEKAGYSFAGWLGENDQEYGETATVKNLTSTNGDVFTMFAQWEYQTARVSEDQSELSYIYSDSVNETINIFHKTIGDGDFMPTLVGVSGETLRGTQITKENYVEVTGITASVDTNVVMLDATSVLTTGDFVLTFVIHDNANEVPDTTLEITVHLGKKELTVTGVECTEKIYDGSKEIPVGTIYFTDGRSTAIEGISVNNSNQKGSFNDANAGTEKDLTLNGVFVYGANADYYTIASDVTLPGVGTIKKRQVRVTTAAVYPEGYDYILTGQTPSFSVTVEQEDLPAAVAEADEALIKQNIIPNIICDYGTTTYGVGTYPLTVNINNVNLINYNAIVSSGNLVVKQETPTEADYTIIGNRLEGSEWYYGTEPRVEATTSSKYNMVYIMSDLSEQVANYDSSKFKSNVVITEEMARGNLYIQLGNNMSSSQSVAAGAVTSAVPLYVKVDITAPVIDTDGITFEAVNNTALKKLGNFLSFGNFFKEEIQVTVPVADLRNDGTEPAVGEVSGAKLITYYLGGDTSGEGKTAEVVNGNATFTIPKGFKGEIAFTTTDNAGNGSATATLIGIEGSDYWVIENTAPEVSIKAEDLDGNTAFAGEGNYYKSVKVTATVADADAGVAYVLWNVEKNGESYIVDEKEVVDSERQVWSQDFTKNFTESGAYSVTVTAYDNANNVSMEMEPVEFVIDGIAPSITVSPEDYDSLWATSKTVTFTVTDLESGVDLLTLKDESGAKYTYTVVDGVNNTYTFTVTKKGTYTIKAMDHAGNITSVPVTFTKVSDEVPDNPVVVISPEIPESVEDVANYWYSENPTITIVEPATTPDGTEIITYYHLWEDGTDEPAYDNDRAGASFQLPGEGVWNLRVWAETESGVKNVYESEDDGLYQIRYDGEAPVISDVLLTGNGSSSRISFKVTEENSGLAKVEAVYNNDEENSEPLLVEYVGDGIYTASFTASMGGSYLIRAIDQARNVGSADAFEPIQITVTGISGNAEKGVTVVGKVQTGTFNIDTIIAQYGLEGSDLSLANALFVTESTDGTLTFTARFTELLPNARYQYQVTALSESGESSTYTGTFKTDAEEVTGVNISGTVVDETLDADDTTDITVMLYNGDAVVQTRNIKNGQTFVFTNIEDGSYTIRAINGNRSISKAVVISGNEVVEPESAIELVLRNGQTTSVKYNNDLATPITVSGLENIFDDSTNFGGTQDNAVINAGGTVEFCLKVTGLNESDVPENDWACIQNDLQKNEAVAMYVDYSIWKRTVGAFGLISETQVTSIAGGKTVRIVIPLSEELQSHDELSVIRVHGTVVERMVDLDTNPGTYTIESALFSTYALAYRDFEEPTTSDTSNGAGNSTSNSSTSNSSTSSSSTSSNYPTGSTSDGNTGNAGNTSNNNNKPTTSTSDISKRPNTSNTVSQSNSSSSPKTGDATPIAMVSVLMLIMGFASVILLKNKKSQ